MNKKITSFLCAIIISMLLMTIPTFQANAAPEPTVSVEPKLNMFSTEDTSVGDTFTVNITAADFVEPGVYAYQFKVYYDNTILEVAAVALPEGHFLTPAPGEEPIFVTELKIFHDEGYVSAAITSMGDPLEPKIGSGTLVTITFSITAAPPPAAALSCDLEFRDVIFLDPDLATIEVTLEHGYYEFSPPRPPVYLSVEPSTVGAADVGTEVVIDIMINEVEEEIKLIAAEWKLRYNTTLLSVIDVTGCDFFKDWAEKAGLDPDDIYFWWLQEDDYVISFTIYAEFAVTPPTVFPEGTGCLATIRFNATYKPETGKATCDLVLDDVMLLDVEENVIPYHHLEDGEYFIPVKPGDLNFDGKIDILDIGTFAKAYGSYPEHPRWNALADLVRDKVINILDAVTIAKNFGK